MLGFKTFTAKKSVKQQEDQADEIKKLKVALKRVTEERDHIKEGCFNQA